jgi:vitamin B12 transporter
MKRSIGGWLFVVCGSWACQASSDAAMEQVFITATRTEIPSEAVLGSIEIITGEELARLPGGDLADALRLRAGIDIARLGGPGQQTSVFIRGSDSNHVLLLVDGVRINPGTIGIAAVQNITPAMVERVEIVKGPRSTLYGSDAIGGVINVITRRGENAGRSVEIGAGAWGTQLAGLSLGWSGDRTDAALMASWLDSEGFPTLVGDEVDRGYRHLSFTGSVHRDLGDWQLSARGWRAAGTSEYSDFFVTPVDQDFVNSAFALEAAGPLGDHAASRVTLGHATDLIRQNQSSDLLETRRWQLEWQADLRLGGYGQLTAGLLLQDEDADSESYGLTFVEGTESRLAYLQHQLGLGRHRWLAAAGYTDHETFGGQFTWNAEYGYSPRADLSMWAAAGTAYRAPDATDRFGFGGNPALLPESARSVEVGLRYRASDRHRLSLVAFHKEVDDLIQYVITDFATFEGENRNVERARITGVEASWDYNAEPWTARMTASLQDPRDLTNNQALLRRSRESLTASLTRSFGAHQVSLDLLAAGQRQDFGFPAPVRLDAYLLVGLAGRFSLNEDWSLTARVENLFDESYELARGYNTMGRSLFVALRRDFH